MSLKQLVIYFVTYNIEIYKLVKCTSYSTFISFFYHCLSKNICGDNLFMSWCITSLAVWHDCTSWSLHYCVISDMAIPIVSLHYCINSNMNVPAVSLHYCISCLNWLYQQYLSIIVSILSDLTVPDVSTLTWMYQLYVYITVSALSDLTVPAVSLHYSINSIWLDSSSCISTLLHQLWQHCTSSISTLLYHCCLTWLY